VDEEDTDEEVQSPEPYDVLFAANMILG
jgi:hypothetical protein